MKLLMVSLLLLLSTQAFAAGSFAVGLGEYKNKIDTQSVSIELDNKPSSGRLYWALELNHYRSDYALHSYTEALAGGGIKLLPDLSAQLLLSDESYKGSIRASRTLFRSVYSIAEVSHRNLFDGGLKRTQATVGLGFNLSKHWSLEAKYKTGNFHAEFVSDQLMIGLAWR